MRRKLSEFVATKPERAERTRDAKATIAQHDQESKQLNAQITQARDALAQAIHPPEADEAEFRLDISSQAPEV